MRLRCDILCRGGVEGLNTVGDEELERMFGNCFVLLGDLLCEISSCMVNSRRCCFQKHSLAQAQKTVRPSSCSDKLAAAHAMCDSMETLCAVGIDAWQDL